MALEAPGRPEVAGQEGSEANLVWEPGPWGNRTPDEYELRYDGSREHYGPHRGTRGEIAEPAHSFWGRRGFTYSFRVRARFGEEWTPWSPELSGVELELTYSGDAGRVTALRVHREIGFGPPDDHLRAHVVFNLDDLGDDRFFGFPLPFFAQEDGEPAPPIDIATGDETGPLEASGLARLDDAWLGTLRAAIATNRGVIISSESTSGLNALVRRIETIPPPRKPSEPWVMSQEGRRIELTWRHDNTGYRGEAVTYDVRYTGTRTLRKKDTGIHSGVTTPDFTFTGKPGYTYCFTVRARNVSGISGWSPEGCAERISKEPVQETLTVQGRLETDIPHEGPVLYRARFAPTGRDPKLLSIRVLGSDLDPWGAHFLPPGSGRGDCANEEIGAVVWPGDALDGDAMSAVYGSAEPATPVSIVACKVLRGQYDRVEPIPIEITYRRWVD